MKVYSKVAINKSIRFLAGFVMVCVFFVALIAAARKQGGGQIKGMEVYLNDDQEYHFLQRKDIEALLIKEQHINLNNASMKHLDLNQMEKIAGTHPWVAEANVFVDNRKVLQVHITQRVPQARIFDATGGSYYIDSMLRMMPVSPGYAYPAPVFTNVVISKSDSLNKIIRAKITYLGAIIAEDSFWNAQITQIDVQPDQSFVLIPLLGNHKIILGDTSDAKEKLRNLYAYYEQVASKIGWETYTTLDLRFKDQIIASPSVGWAPPRDSTRIAQEFVDVVQQPIKATAVSGSEVVRNKPASLQAVQREKVQKVVKAKTQLSKGESVKKQQDAMPKPKYIYQGNK